VSVGEIGAQALDASVVTTEPESPAFKAALLHEAEGQLAAAHRAVDGAAIKYEKYQALVAAAKSDYEHAEREVDRLVLRCAALREELGV